MDNLYNEVVMISNKCRDRAVYYGRKMRREENELVAERAAVLEQEYSIIHSDLERAIGNNPPAEDKEKPENSSQAVQQLKEAIALLEECNAQLLSCSGCELTIRTINLKPFSLGFRIATFLKGQQASV